MIGVGSSKSGRLMGGLLWLFSIVALLPVSLLALGGMMSLGAPSLGLKDMALGSAIAFVGPLAFSASTAFGWRAYQQGENRDLVKGYIAFFFALALYLTVWSLAP